MPAIESGEAAIAAAERLVQKYHQFRVLRKTHREGAVWIIEFDVGVVQPQIVRITLDAETGNLVEYKGPGL